MEGYTRLYKSHLDQTVLDHIPKDAFSRLDDKEMVDKPNLDEYVFVKVIETCRISASDKENQYEPGATLITRWSAVQNLFSAKKIQLVL